MTRRYCEINAFEVRECSETSPLNVAESQGQKYFQINDEGAAPEASEIYT